MTALLEAESLVASCGKRIAIKDVSLRIKAGATVSVVGANGAGKSTLLNVLMGLHPARRGNIAFAGRTISRLSAESRFEMGLALVPERRELFSTMSVEDNLRLGAYTSSRASRHDLTLVFDYFPQLRERRKHTAATLSGGEQQMLAIGRALISRPQLLMLDEPSVGLAPRIVHDLFCTIRSLREAGVSVLVAEQDARAALTLSDFVYVINVGKIAFQGTAAEFRSNDRPLPSERASPNVAVVASRSF